MGCWAAERAERSAELEMIGALAKVLLRVETAAALMVWSARNQTAVRR